MTTNKKVARCKLSLLKTVPKCRSLIWVKKVTRHRLCVLINRQTYQTTNEQPEMIVTLPDHDKRRRIINKTHRTNDKELYRRLNAILLLADGHSVSAVSRLTAAARSSINRWVNWYTLYGLEGLESEPRGRKPVLPFAHFQVYYCC